MSVAQGHGGRPSAGSRSRYRPRQEVARVRSVKFRLTEEEFGELSEAAGRARMAMGAYAAEAALSAARGTAAEPDVQLREALGEVMRAAGLVRRIGVLLNQAVAKLNATGQRPGELVPVALACRSRVENLNDVAEHLRRKVR
ncbi:MAG TPA: hypothetical protein VG164_03150 [Trebonia sp.]|nr:hypothetical protein [Trebonia sp.]